MKIGDWLIMLMSLSVSPQEAVAGLKFPPALPLEKLKTIRMIGAPMVTLGVA